MAAGGKVDGSSFGHHLRCKDLHDYLQGLPANTLDKLYGHPATCFAVFRYNTIFNCFSTKWQPVILLDWDSESDTTVHVIVSVISKFRELPELAKHFVMRTLFAEQPLPETLVSAWVKKDHQK